MRKGLTPPNSHREAQTRMGRPPVRRGRRFESVRGLRFLPANQLLSSSGMATETRRGVHRASTARRVRVLRGLELI